MDNTDAHVGLTTDARFSDTYLCELRARLPLAKVVASDVRLKQAGKNFTGLCPFHAEKTPSFNVYPDGRFHCFGCAATGDVFAYVGKRRGLTFIQAVEAVAHEANLSAPDTHIVPRVTPPASQPTAGDWHPILPVPDDAPPPSETALKCDVLYTYRAADGRTLCFVRRFEAKGSRKKSFLPLCFGTEKGKTGWHNKAPATPRPLYGLDLLADRPNATALVCEGEKAATAARWLFPEMVSVSWMGGKLADKVADWNPLIGRDVIVWPDNDPDGEGQAAGRRIAERLPGSRLLRVDDMPAHGDAADLITDNPDAWLEDHLPQGSPEDRQDNADDMKPQLPLLWLNEIEAVLEARDFVQGVLTDGSAAVVYGESNAGKTFWVSDLVLHVAAGKRWNGRRVEQGGVVYCAMEGGDGFRNRVAAWRAAHAVPGMQVHFAAVTSAINLLDPHADTPKLIATVKAAATLMTIPVKLIVVDTLSRALAGGNENAPDDMGSVVRNMDEIRAATGACLLFVHHSGKDVARGARGHSLLRAAVDTEIEVVAGETANVATVVKQRDLAKGAAFGFRLDVVVLGKNQHSEDVTTLVVTPDVAGAAPDNRKTSKLKDEAVALLRLIEMAVAEGRGKLVSPLLGMPLVTALNRREVLRPWLAMRGWFSDALLSTGPGNLKAVLRTGLTHESNHLRALERRGFLAYTGEWVWLL